MLLESNRNILVIVLVPETWQEPQDTPSGLRSVRSSDRCYESKTTFWKMLTWIVPFFLTAVVAIWIYHLSYVTEPIVAMKKDVEYVIKNIEELSAKYKELERSNKAIEWKLAELKTELKYLLHENKKLNVEIQKLRIKELLPKESYDYIESPK